MHMHTHMHTHYLHTHTNTHARTHTGRNPACRDATAWTCRSHARHHLYPPHQDLPGFRQILPKGKFKVQVFPTRVVVVAVGVDYKHTHTHTYTHTYTHTHTNTHTHTLTQVKATSSYKYDHCFWTTQLLCALLVTRVGQNVHIHLTRAHTHILPLHTHAHIHMHTYIYTRCHACSLPPFAQVAVKDMTIAIAQGECMGLLG